MSEPLYTGITVGQEKWAFRRFPIGIEVYDPDGDRQFMIPGEGHSEKLVEFIAQTYDKGVQVGTGVGREQMKFEFRKLIGVGQ